MTKEQWEEFFKMLEEAPYEKPVWTISPTMMAEMEKVIKEEWEKNFKPKTT